MKKILLSLLILLTLVSCAKHSSQKEEPKNKEKVEEKLPPNTLSFDKLEFDTIDINGDRVKSSDIFNKSDLTIVYVWSTGCSNCVDSLEQFKKFDDEMFEKKLQILGIISDTVMNSPNNIQRAQEILDKAGVEFVNVVPNPTMEKYQEDFKPPTTFFVNGEGKVVGGTFDKKMEYKDIKSAYDLTVEEE